MSLNICDLEQLELQELSDQECKAAFGGGRFGCFVGAVIGLGGGLLGAAGGCLLVSKVEDLVN